MAAAVAAVLVFSQDGPSEEVRVQDEPTSGLDARAAAIVIRSVKSVAESGRTVMVVVHQPSIDIFYSFTYLMLFAKCASDVTGYRN